MYPSPTLGGSSKIAFYSSSSHRRAWTDHGRPSVHTTLGANPGSTADVPHPAVASRISILDALSQLMEPVVAGQLLQHDDALDTALME
jgi:hypothetical protein